MKLHQRFLLFNLFFLLFINSSPSMANDVEKSVDTYAYHPGLYAHDMSISALDSSRFNHIRGVVVLYKMKDLMPSENSVNLQPIHDSISQLQNLENYQGDGRLIIQVTYNRDYALPGWMKKNPKFGWAGVTANGYSENRNAPSKIYGVFYRTGKPSSITSYSGNYAPIYTNPEWVKVHNRLMQAIANEFDSNPLVEMIAGVTGETSKYDPPAFSGWRWGRNGNPTEYEYLRERIDTVSSMFSQTRMRVTYNYLDSSYPGGVNAMRNSIELDIANKGVVLSSPDVHPSYHSKCSQYFGKVGSRCNKGIDQTYPTNAIFRYFQEYKDRIPTVATISSESIYNNPRGVNKRRSVWYRNNDMQLVQASAQDFIDLLLNQPDGVWAQHHDSDVRDFYGNGGPQVHYIFVVGYSGLSEDRGKYNFLRETGGFADKIKSYLDAGGTIPPSSVNYVSNSGGGAPTPGDDTPALPLVMTLNGSNPVTVVQGKSFIDPGAIVSRDGDFVKVVMSNDRVNINKKGKYILTYAAQDSYGSKVTAVRTVNVVSSGSGVGNISIRVDGNISDWKDVTPIATANSQSLKTLKMVSDASHIYFLIEGSGIGVNTQLHLNVDNKAATGYQTNNWKSSGIDYLVENDWLYKSTRNDASWSWGSANSSAVVYKRSSSAIEISVKKSAISGLKETIKVGVWDLNGSWNVVSGLPKFGNAMAVFSAGPPPPEPPALDKTPPVITLNGSSSMTLAQGSSFVDPGATAWDNKDGNVNVTKTGSVNSSREGRYTITYSARDKAGNEATKTRVVVVRVNSSGTDKPYLVLAGDFTPTNVNANISYIETLPFDGGIITPVTSWIIANGNSHPGYGALWNEIKDMNFRKWDKNYLLLMIGNPPDFFDDWSNVIAYWRDYAKAAKAMGTFAGIAFDNEEYAGPVWGYPGAVNYRNRSLQAYRDQARLRGRQIMQAMQEEFPDISVIHYHGPYASDPNTPNAVSLYQLEPDESNLMGSFFMGMVEAKNATSKVIDGGEVYQYRTPNEFKNSYQWRKYTMASSSNNSPVIPRNERSAYPDNVSISFGLYNYNWTQWVDGTGHPMNPSIMENVVEYSLNNADDVVWLYTEDMNWAGGGVSSAWINAVRNGREAAKAY